MKKYNIRTLVYMAIFIALSIVATRIFSIDTPFLRIGIGFMPVIMAAMYLGPFKAGWIGVIADIIGFMLFPKGTFFPGFTISAFLGGFINGFFLEGERGGKMVNIILNAVISTLLIDTIINTGNLVILMHGGQFDKFIPLLITRFPNHVALMVEKVIFTFVFYHAIFKRVRLKGVEKRPPKTGRYIQ